MSGVNFVSRGGGTASGISKRSVEENSAFALLLVLKILSKSVGASRFGKKAKGHDFVCLFPKVLVHMQEMSPAEISYNRQRLILSMLDRSEHLIAQHI